MEGQTIQLSNEKKKNGQILHRKPKCLGILINRSNLNGRTDNTMIKRKKDKGTNITQKTRVSYL
jgi:hypothetical protein